MTQMALDAATALASEGTEAGVLHLHTIKPLDVAGLRAFADGHRALVVAEEHSAIGGLGSAVCDALCASGHLRRLPLVRLAFPDAFLHGYGSQRDLMDAAGLNMNGLVEAARAALTQA